MTFDMTRKFSGILALVILAFITPPLVNGAMAASLELNSQCADENAQVVYTLTIHDAANTVDALGLDIVYDPSVLRYDGADYSGTLLDLFSFKEATLVEPGTLRMGAFTVSNPILEGSSGEIAFLTFTVLQNKKSEITLHNLKDDIQWWETRSGMLHPVISYHIDTDEDGDADGFDLARFAYEFKHATSMADLNEDGVVDGKDVAVFSESYSNIGCPEL